MKRRDERSASAEDDARIAMTKGAESGDQCGDRGQAAQQVGAIGLTRDFKETVIARVERDPAFAKELLVEATTLVIGGEGDTARVILRDLVNATLGS